jgi:RNA polymerase sigma factor (sigma-70 family)
MEADQQWWHSWLSTNGPKLVLYARNWARSRSDAEDIVQEAFVRYWTRQRDLPGEPLGLVLLSIRRVAIDRARSEDRRTMRETRYVADAIDQSRWFACHPAFSTAELESAILALPAPQREVLLLRTWGEQDFKSIAEKQDVPVKTAVSRYRYALAALKDRLQSAFRHA